MFETSRVKGKATNIKIKTKIGGGNGGHNGLSNIDEMIGNDYYRIRVGIDHPGEKYLVSNYVLNKFNETYLQGLRVTFKVSFTMIVTRVFCLIRGLIQGLFKKLSAIKSLKLTKWFQETKICLDNNINNLNKYIKLND